MKKILFFTIALVTFSAIYGQFTVSIDSAYTQLVNNFILSGVNASNVQYAGYSHSCGSFTGGLNTNLGVDEGIVLISGKIDDPNYSIGHSVTGFMSTSNGFPGDPLLDALVGCTTYDASVLSFDLVPSGNILEFEYVFGSEEYPEWVGSTFNDVFGFFISGPNPLGGEYINENIAIIPGGSLPVAINNVNAQTNSQYFIDNETLGGTTIVYDGFTTVLTVQIDVIHDTLYHLVLAVGDASDDIYDSGVFLKSPSLKSYNATSIQETDSPTLIVSSNPINDETIVEIITLENEFCDIIISDYCGKIVIYRNCALVSGSNVFPIGEWMYGLSTGMYLCKVSSPSNNSILKLLVP